MSDNMNEKTTFGATIEPPRTPAQDAGRDAPPSPLTTASLPAANPFYAHDDGNRTSTDLKVPPAYTRDLEAQRSNADLSLANTKASCTSQKQHESMWPTLKSIREKAKQDKADKCAKSWNPMARMGRKQKLIVTVVIALVIIGAAVGIGVGVSIATGNGTKTGSGGNRPIGDKDS